MNKRILSVLLVALMVVAMVVGAVTVSAAGGNVENFGDLEAMGEDGGRAKLAKSIDENGVLEVTKNLTLDLNGCKLTLYGIVVRGTKDHPVTLTIKDSEGDGYGKLLVRAVLDADVEATGITTANKYSTVTIESGYIGQSGYGTPKDVDAPIAVFNGGTVNVNGGLINGYYADKVDVYSGNVAIWVEDGTLNVNGGTIYGEPEGKGETSAAIFVSNEGNVNVKDGTVQSKTGNAIYTHENARGDVKISGGTVVATDTGTAVYSEGATVKITKDAQILANTTANTKGTAVKVTEHGDVEIDAQAIIKADTAIDTDTGAAIIVDGGTIDGAIKCGDAEPFIRGGNIAVNTVTANGGVNSLKALLDMAHDHEA